MRDQERNLANFTVARRKHSGGLLIGTVMKIRMPSAGRETGGGLGVIGRRSAARGDVFSRVDPISVSNDEFRCSAASFFGGKAMGKGLPYGNGI